MVAVAEHAFLRNAWYVAAWDHLIGDDLTALTILGDDIKNHVTEFAVHIRVN